MRKNYYLPREIASKKQTARFLIVVKGYTQKEASEFVDISERTIGEWVRKYNWTYDSDISPGGINEVLADFFEFVKKKAPVLGKNIKSLWDEFARQMKEGTSGM